MHTLNRVSSASDVRPREQFVDGGRTFKERQHNEGGSTEPEAAAQRFRAAALLGLEDPSRALIAANKARQLSPLSSLGYRLAASALLGLHRDDDAATFKMVGHNEQMQFLSRIEKDTTTAYGQKLSKGSVFFLRQDFDTVENPFGFWSDGQVSATHRAGVHFIGFGPSGQHFEAMRREMDSQDLKAQHDLQDEDLGFTKMLITTHRQNYLLPPRAHRAFPLVELL